MSKTEFDITTYALLDSESVGLSFNHITSLEHFRNHVVRPSLQTLSKKLEELRASDEIGAVFLVGDIEELMKRSIEGYIIAVQSMWERGLRGLLSSCESRICNGQSLNAIKTATWNGKSVNLQEHFLRLLGVPIHSFSSFADLDFLQTLGNAIRHGDGNSAQRIYQLCPSLWPSWLTSEQITLFESMGFFPAKSKPNVLPFEQIAIPPNLLDQMMQSVLWFWEDMENMRCNSFRRKHESVIRKLSTWRANIDNRILERVWNID